MLGECILYRGTTGVTKHLREAQQGILVYWHTQQKSPAVSVKPVYEVDWQSVKPSTFSGVLYSHMGTSAKNERTNDPHTVIVGNPLITDTWPPDEPMTQPYQAMPQFTWHPTGPVFPRPEPVKILKAQNKKAQNNQSSPCSQRL